MVIPLLTYFFIFLFLFMMIKQTTFITIIKKTLQRQISSIPARHNKHDIARNIALKTLEKKKENTDTKTKLTKKQTH